MVSTDKVLGFETNPYKQTCRNVLTSIIKSELGHLPKITGASLCGASAEFENQIVKEIPNSHIYCIENNKQTAKIAEKNIPKECKLIVNDWQALKKHKLNNLDWMWADFCFNPTPDNCLNVRKDMFWISDWMKKENSGNSKVYAVTFDIGCRGIKGGANQAASALIGTFGKASISGYFKEKERIYTCDEKTKGVIKHIIRYLSTPYLFQKGYVPHTVIYYGGGKNKNNPCVPMLTLIYCLNDKYKVTNQRWSWKQEAGYKGVNFINLFDVKNGRAKLIEGELKMKKIKVSNVKKVNKTAINSNGSKNPIMVIAGYKAWQTRIANDQKKKQIEAGHKAWETRTENEKKQKQSEAGRKAWETRRKNQMA